MTIDKKLINWLIYVFFTIIILTIISLKYKLNKKASANATEFVTDFVDRIGGGAAHNWTWHGTASRQKWTWRERHGADEQKEKSS